LLAPTDLAFRVTHPTGDLDMPALPFPFTADQFIAFCNSCLYFPIEDIAMKYSNDDDSLDERALAELAMLSLPAAELVRTLLTGEGYCAGRHAAVATSQIPPREKALDRNLRLLREILRRLGNDGESVPLEKGGARGSGLKKEALAMSSTPEFAGQGLTPRNFREAWERIPKKP